MAEHARDELVRVRHAFFERTRWLACFLYGGFAVGAIGAAVPAFARDAGSAAIGVAIGVGAGAILWATSPLLRPVSPRVTRLLSFVAVPLAVVLANHFLPVGPLVLGVIAGFLGASVWGLAWNRRRLAYDDELLARSIRRGWDPAHPYRSIWKGR
jgi:hypothetical protein